MKRVRSAALAALTLAVVSVVTLVGQAPPPTAAKMSDAAKKLLAALPPEQQKKAAFAFDDKHRLAWFFTPQQDKQKQFTRKGVRLEELNAAQKAAAMELLRSGLSAKGYEQATTIIGLEQLLNEWEGPKGG